MSMFKSAVSGTIARTGISATLDRTSATLKVVFDSRYDSIQRRIGDYVFNFKPGNVALIYYNADVDIRENDVLTIDSVKWNIESPSSAVYEKDVAIMKSVLAIRQQTLTSSLA
jgi:hypothetical protein